MDEQLHGFSLVTYYVDYGGFKSDLAPQGDNTSLARPFASTGSIEAPTVEFPGGTRLDRPTHGDPCPGGADHGMYVSLSDMNRPGKPSPQETGFQDCLEDTPAPRATEGIGLDIQGTDHGGLQSAILAWQTPAILVVKRIYAAATVAVQGNAVTRKR